MARGDYVRVTYRTGVGTAQREVVAQTVGAHVRWAEPRKGDQFMSVDVIGQNGEAFEKNLFAAADVVMVMEGHQVLKRKAAK